MDKNEMKAFLTLYEKKGIRQAASELFISPQGLSRVLQKLETEYKVTLFQRTVHGLIPTEMGKYLYTETKKLYELQLNISKNLLAISAQNKDIRVVCSYGAMEALDYECIVMFQKAYPEISLSWREYSDKQAIAALLNNEYSIGLIAKGKSECYEDFSEKLLFTKSVVILVYEGHPLYGKERIELKDLEHEALILEGDDFWINHAFREKCLSEGIVPNITIETGDISFLHKLCSLKQGIGISIDFVADKIYMNNVKAIPLDEDVFSWSVFLLTRKSMVMSEQEQKFCNYITAQSNVK